MLQILKYAKSLCCLLVSALLQTELNASTSRQGIDESHSSDVTAACPPPAKKSRFSLFGHYAGNSRSPEDSRRHERQLVHYLDTINSVSFNPADTSLPALLCQNDFSTLRPLFERLLCTPASSAPVERVFSQSGLLLRPHRARMSDALLEALVFLKCNQTE